MTFYQKGVDLPRAKLSAMFVLIATVILCYFKHACVLVNIYFNDMKIYRWIHCMSYIHIVVYKEIYKLLQFFLLTVKIDGNLFLKNNILKKLIYRKFTHTR